MSNEVVIYLQQQEILPPEKAITAIWGHLVAIEKILTGLSKTDLNRLRHAKILADDDTYATGIESLCAFADFFSSVGTNLCNWTNNIAFLIGMPVRRRICESYPKPS